MTYLLTVAMYSFLVIGVSVLLVGWSVVSVADCVTSECLLQVLVPIGFGTEEMEAVILIDVLRRAGSDVTVASVETELQIEASRRVKLVADRPISACTEEMFDLIVLPVCLLFISSIHLLCKI